MTATATATPAPVEAQIDLGCLFATLHASFVGDVAFGAHVTLDGTVIANGNLRHVAEDADAIDKVRALRSEATHQIRNAYRECGMRLDDAAEAQILRDVVRAIPMRPAIIAVYGEDAV